MSLKNMALPPESTAAQKPVVGHDTERTLPPGSTLTGADHVDPLKVSAIPE
jgi:hypothetical protein